VKLWTPILPVHHSGAAINAFIKGIKDAGRVNRW